MIDGTGAEALTVSAAQNVFESMLSADTEEPKDRETPPAQETPEPEQPEPDATEQVAEEGESEQTETPEAETEQPDSNAVDPSTKLKTKVDGQEIEVTLEEALKGYSRTQDYTRKTQELSERRKAFETEAQAVRAERVQVAEYLKNLEQVVAEISPKEPDWAKVQQEQPAEFPTMWAQWQAHKQERDLVTQRRQEAEQLVAKDRFEHMQAHVESEKAKLIDMIPEWKNAETAKAEKAKLVTFATKAGYSNDDLAQVTDARAINLLLKAMRYDEMMAKKPAVAAKIEKVKTATPGSAGVNTRSPVTDTTRALQRLAKTGKPQDAEAAFLKMLEA